VEADDHGDLPEDLRASLLAHDGSWAVVVESAPDVTFLKALRECLNLSLAELSDLRARLPGVLAEGTRCEMQVLANQLGRVTETRCSIQVVRA
jgi:hypothetical protein